MHDCLKNRAARADSAAVQSQSECRLALATLFLSVFVTAILLVLNFRESRTISEPYYTSMLGARRHAPPYAMKEMAIDLHNDCGWPIWHTRNTISFAAHNGGVYLNGDCPQFGASSDSLHDFDFVFNEGTEISYSPPSPTDWTRAGFDAIVAFLIVVIGASISEFAIRRIRTLRER
jgi:hypothetical protein